MRPDRPLPAKTFQDLILRLQNFWADYGCVLGQPFDIEKGAGTYNPHTFLRVLGPEPWKVAYVEPSRRPTDGRYGDNPNRLYRHHQFQVVLKPSPSDMQGLYLRSMRAIGIHPEEHDIRFVEDNWESPTLGAWGLGWEVWVDGMELTQFTYFQQCGGIECRPVSAELTYGLERIAMYLQGKDNVYDLEYAPGIKYREIFHQDEVEYSKFHFNTLDVAMYFSLFEAYEKEVGRLCELKLVIPAYDHLLRAAHSFNSLDARGAISVTERQGYILRIRDLAKRCAEGYLELRASLGYPLSSGPSTHRESVAPGEVSAPEESALGGRTLGDAQVGPRALFLEVGTEELPAGEVMPAVEALSQGITRRLDALRLSHGAARVYATPRRIAVAVPDVAERQEDLTREVLGPPVSAAFKDGAPTKAAIGFATGQGVLVSDLTRLATPKGEYLVAIVEEKGRMAREVLVEVLEQAIAEIPFARSMRWGTGDVAFSRPVEWIVALSGGDVLPVSFAGVLAGRTSRGHRFLAPEPFDVFDERQYVSELEGRRVIADVAKRRKMIVDGAAEKAREVRGTILKDEGLVDEITQLVEYPVVLCGRFDPSFLEIPQGVLISEMRHHQRYLSVVDEEGKLTEHFVVVANTSVEDPKVSLEGYRRVLSARFQDGAFFFTEDLKTTLYDRVDKLKTVVFHRALGTTYEKVERVAKLARYIAGSLAPGSSPVDFGEELTRAAYLMKADLATLMVFEFPELQGEIGSEYARRNGELPEVADAIADHYRPRSAEDALPRSDLGAILGLADRFDTIAGIFSIGKGPTGTADPYGLRRATLGIVRILEGRRWHLSLEKILLQSIELFGSKRKKETTVVADEIREFFRTRLRGVLTQGGIAVDVAEAVLSAGYDDVVDAAARARALAVLREKAEFDPIAVTFKRVANILRGQDVTEVRAEGLEIEAERRLFEVERHVEARVLEAVRKGDFVAAIASIAELRPSVDAFFEAVMVMDEDPVVRARRIALVSRAHKIFAPIADFTKLS